MALRRLALLALLLGAAGAWAQAPQAVKLGTLGVFALLGDTVQVTAAQGPYINKLDNTERESLDFKGIAFDAITLKAVSEQVLGAQPATRMRLYQAPAGLSLLEQREIARGAENAELPGWMVRALQDDQLTHLLIITRTRGELDARTLDGDGLGRAQVEGIGFYLDLLYTMRNIATGALSNGLLAPYVQIKLTLMDARSGDIVGRHEIRESFAYAATEEKGRADPWTFMSTEEKVTRLRQMVDRGVRRGLGEVLKPR